jgi:glycosyltransferase involved in cell wall biosynthesis
VRIAYTLEQCWHRVPGGTGVAAIEVAKELAERSDVQVRGAAGRHRRPHTNGFEPPLAMDWLPIGSPWLYETWMRLGWPKVESVSDADLVHSTTLIPPATNKPLVVTVHDLAFLHHPEFFTDRGNKVFRKSLNIVRDKAAIVLCSSQATLNDCLAEGIEAERLRHVPLGVRTHPVTDADRERVRVTYDLPREFILFVGTLEPRKNLHRLLESLNKVRHAPPLVIAGMQGWGDAVPATNHDVRFLGYVPAHNLAALYDACSVFAFPSLLEGFGLPVVEAMAHGAAVVTSSGTSTEEVAGGAAELVDPLSVDSISQGITNALANHGTLAARGLLRAAELSWSHTAELTVQAYREVLGAS